LLIVAKIAERENSFKRERDFCIIYLLKINLRALTFQFNRFSLPKTIINN